MNTRDLWLAWAAMLALALFGMVMAGPAHAQHWHGGGFHGWMRGGFHGPAMVRPMGGGWHGGGYYRGGWGVPGAVVGGLAAGLAAGVGASLAAPAVGYGSPYYNNPCWRWDGITGWYRVC